MTIITLDEDIKLKKNHFKNINELLLVNLIYKRKKLSLKQLIKKYDLKESHSGKIVNVSDNVDKIAYNI